MPRPFPVPFLPIWLLPLVLASAAPAMASSTPFSGRLLDEQHRPVAGARVQLRNRVSGYRQGTRSDAAGRFTLHNVPLGDYHLEVFAKGLEAVHRDLELRTALPLELTLPLRAVGTTVAVEEPLSLVEGHPAVHLDIDKSSIRLAPAPVQSRAMESILLATPGFTANDNGRFHFRGSHGQLTTVVDGIPLSDHTHATHSNSLDPAQVESLSVLTGGIPAEYGGKPVAVVQLTTRSGLGTPNGFEGELSLGAARFRTFETGLSVRGGTERFGYFVTGAASRTDRFLDPPTFQSLHNSGETGRLFSRFDWLLGDTDTLRVSACGGRTDREVPNLPSQARARQEQDFASGDANLSLAWAHLLSPTWSFEASAYLRRATARLDPTRALAPGFPEGGPDTPTWARLDRTLENRGVQAATTLRFQLAITRDGLVDPTSGFYPFTPAGGGSLFAFREHIQPSLASAFVQSDLHLGRLLLALGLRYDRWSLRGKAEDALQPRLGASYRLPTGTVLRASYDRLMITPDRENLALSSSPTVAALGADPAAPQPFRQVSPEIQDSRSLGLEQQLGHWGRLALDAWERQGRNTADVEVFVNTGVEFPVALSHGFFHGVDLRLDVAPTQGWSGFLSLGRTRALAEGPIAGGLSLFTGASEAEETGRFPIDHDQKLAAQWGLRREAEAWWIQIGGRYDSGLVAGDPAGAAGDPDLEEGLPYVRWDAADGVWRAKPRTIWNLGAGWRFDLGGRRSLTLGGDLLNATNRRCLYNFLSHRGGTHVHPPRTWAFRIRYAF